MTTCSFCSRSVEKGTGIMYVQNDGKILNFCAGKCQKNLLKLNRKPGNFKWAQHIKAKSKT